MDPKDIQKAADEAAENLLLSGESEVTVTDGLLKAILSPEDKDVRLQIVKAVQPANLLTLVDFNDDELKIIAKAAGVEVEGDETSGLLLKSVEKDRNAVDIAVCEHFETVYQKAKKADDEEEEGGKCKKCDKLMKMCKCSEKATDDEPDPDDGDIVDDPDGDLPEGVEKAIEEFREGGNELQLKIDLENFHKVIFGIQKSLGGTQGAVIALAQYQEATEKRLATMQKSVDEILSKAQALCIGNATLLSSSKENGKVNKALKETLSKAIVPGSERGNGAVPSGEHLTDLLALGKAAGAGNGEGELPKGQKVGDELFQKAMASNTLNANGWGKREDIMRYRKLTGGYLPPEVTIDESVTNAAVAKGLAG